MMAFEVFTIGGGDLLQDVFNSIAMVFNDKKGISTITSLAVMMGGLFATFEFTKTHDLRVLIRWVGCYVLITSLMLYPKTTIVIEDMGGTDLKPRMVDNVPISLAMFASFTSRLGIGFTQAIETVFHLPDDMEYNKTGMLMASKLILASKNFQITDPAFTQTLNEFMQQCVFYDLLLQKYSIQDLIHTDNPWDFIKSHTSQARAFPFQGEITICNAGAAKLDTLWQQEINNAASVYGGQLLQGTNTPAKLLLSHLSDGYNFLTNVSIQGEEILKTNLLANAMSNAITHYGASSNAPAALAAYEDTKAELQARETLDQTGRQAAVWMQYYKNIIEAVLYSSFLFIYFLSYFPFGGAIIRNYLCGMFVLQALAPMYAIINFAANCFAQNRSIAFLSTDTSHAGLSIANLAGVSQANADAMAVAGYLMWPVTIGGAIMLFRGLPGAIQSMGQLLGGVAQHSGGHVATESIGGNISTGNASFGNRSMGNTSANHFDTNARYAAGGAVLQTGTGSSLSITPEGGEVLDNRAAMSNLSSNIHWSDSIRMVASQQAQSSLNAAITNSRSAGEHYATAIRKMEDYSHQQSHFKSSSNSLSETQTTGFSQSSHQVSQLVDSFAKEHHISHDRSAQVLGQVYADAKGGFSVLGNGVGVGAQASLSASGRSSFGSLYNEATRFSADKNFSETVDSARRAAVEGHFRDSLDEGNRFGKSIASSFDQGDQYRSEASNQLTKSQNYSNFASSSNETASSISANYNQEFYQWMRQQPSPQGQGLMSKSAIDNMSVHDNQLLQSYANQFVQEKMQTQLATFNANNHISHGNSNVESISNHNNSTINAVRQHQQHYEDINRGLSTHANNVMDTGEQLQAVNSNIANNIVNDIRHDKSVLSSNHEEIVNTNNEQDQKIKSKIKGQVLGSIDPTKNSLLEKIESNRAPLTYFKENDSD